MRLLVTADEIVNGGLWKLFPAIEVSKTKDIPCDYPGPMGVPRTALDKIQTINEPKRIALLDSLRPILNGKALYLRIIIRNLYPDLPKGEIDLEQMLLKSGVNLIIGLDSETQEKGGE